MNHLSHDEIVLSYYGEALPEERSRHLTCCADCAAELHSLAGVLDRVTPVSVPEPDAGYEQQVWDRLSWRLRTERRRSGVRAWTWVAATAAALALAFTAGLLWNRRAASPIPGPAVAASSPQTTARPDRVLLVVVADHIDQSERMLVELTNLTPDGDVDISQERERADALLASNRLYRRTASDRGEEGVATLLDELEPVLIQIARSPDEVSADELREMQERVAAKGLVFKLRVVRADVRAGAGLTPNNRKNI
jgi:hypothetical protein